MNKRVSFGAGAVFIKDGTGDTHRVAIVSEASVEQSQALVELYGGNKYPEDVAEGKASLKGSLKFSHVDPRLINAILGGSSATGHSAVKTDTGLIPANPGPYTVAIAPPSSGTWGEDLGVYIAGVPAEPVASNPSTGQYAVTAGTYTFAAADQGKAYEISYRYTLTAGSTVTVTNAAMGLANAYSLVLYNEYRTTKLGLKFHAVSIGKWGLNFGNEAHATQDSEFTAFADATTGKVVEVWNG